MPFNNTYYKIIPTIEFDSFRKNQPMSQLNIINLHKGCWSSFTWMMVVAKEVKVGQQQIEIRSQTIDFEMIPRLSWGLSWDLMSLFNKSRGSPLPEKSPSPPPFNGAPWQNFTNTPNEMNNIVLSCFRPAMWMNDVQEQENGRPPPRCLWWW